MDKPLLSLFSVVTQNYYYYRLDTPTEEGFRFMEHYDTKITIFENAGLL